MSEPTMESTDWILGELESLARKADPENLFYRRLIQALLPVLQSDCVLLAIQLESKPLVLDRVGTGELAIEIGLSKVSVVGTGMKSHVGVASRLFTALGAAGIPIHNITTSEIKISCILGKEHAKRALEITHDVFGLDKLGARQQAASAQPA